MTEPRSNVQLAARTSPRPAAGTTAPRQLTFGVATMVGSSVSNQAGAAIGALAFPVIGPVGVVAVRQLVTALVLGAAVRPRFRSMTGAQFRPVLGLAVVFSVMNLSLYSAVERIGLGLAVTLEFLGPLAVAVLTSGRVIDVACAIMAGVGVLVLTDPGPTTDYLGIGLALTAAAAWAGYILLNRTLGQRLPGVRGTTAASTLSAIAWIPLTVVWFVHHPPTVESLLFAVACGILASAIPFAADLITLRRLPAGLFGTLTSLNPVWAALSGWLILHQTLSAHQLTGIGLIAASNIAVTIAGFARRGVGFS
ncbi:EamA family transporter [Rhodococcus opacus]|uniref:EamA family transporter n=1 Tax=Rhodococcus opacus TaxID=37919 RepID=UPI0027E0A200|nr:EamA family transporter [Rhodococcus opacus]